MAARNDITGDLIKTKANSDTEAYADGWERIFGKKNNEFEFGEIGVDSEASPGNGQWYVNHYATGYHVVGFATRDEAYEELMYVEKHKDRVVDDKTAANKSMDSALCDICGKELSKVGECAWTSCPLNWNEARVDVIGQNGNIGYGEPQNE